MATHFHSALPFLGLYIGEAEEVEPFIYRAWTTHVMLIEDETSIVMHTKTFGQRVVDRFDKTLPNLDLQLGQTLRIYSRNYYEGKLT